MKKPKQDIAKACELYFSTHVMTIMMTSPKQKNLQMSVNVLTKLYIVTRSRITIYSEISSYCCPCDNLLPFLLRKMKQTVLLVPYIPHYAKAPSTNNYNCYLHWKLRQQLLIPSTEKTWTAADCTSNRSNLEFVLSDIGEVKVMSDLALISAGEEPMAVDRVSCFLSAVMGFSPLIFDLDETSDWNKFHKAYEQVWSNVRRDSKLPDKWVRCAASRTNYPCPLV